MMRLAMSLTLGLLLACSAPVPRSGGWMQPEVTYGDVALVIDAGAPPAERKGPLGVGPAVADAFRSSRSVTTVRTVDAAAPMPGDADTIASFALRFDGGEVSAGLLPWPSLTVRRELRYQLRLTDVATGTILGDTERTFVLQGPEALREWDLAWITADVRRVLDGNPAERGAGTRPN